MVIGLLIIFFCFYFALRLLCRSRKRTMSFRGTEYEVAAQDEMFESKKLGLRGKPDAVLKAGDRYVVIEYKTGRRRESDVVQLYAYLYLVESVKKKPCIGYLVYQNSGSKRTYGPYWLDDEKRKFVEEGIELVKEIKEGKAVPPGEESECRACEFAVRCEVFLSGMNNYTQSFKERWRKWKDEKILAVKSF